MRNAKMALKILLNIKKYFEYNFVNPFFFTFHIMRYKRQFFDKSLLFQYFNGIFMFILKYFAIKIN